MGITEVLTVFFVVCKILSIGQIAHWSWFQCLLPEFIAGIFYIAIIIGVIWIAFKKH